MSAWKTVLIILLIILAVYVIAAWMRKRRNVNNIIDNLGGGGSEGINPQTVKNVFGESALKFGMTPKPLFSSSSPVFEKVSNPASQEILETPNSTESLFDIPEGTLSEKVDDFSDAKDAGKPANEYLKLANPEQSKWNIEQLLPKNIRNMNSSLCGDGKFTRENMEDDLVNVFVPNLLDIGVAADRFTVGTQKRTKITDPRGYPVIFGDRSNIPFGLSAITPLDMVDDYEYFNRANSLC